MLRFNSECLFQLQTFVFCLSQLYDSVLCQPIRDDDDTIKGGDETAEDTSIENCQQTDVSLSRLNSQHY